MPPSAPLADERVIDGKDDPVAADCASSETRLLKSSHAKVRKIVITRSPKWGTVWRADSAMPTDLDGQPMLWRTVCTEHLVVERPLVMLDPKASIPPLK
jgi:hypothetical protein